MRPLPRSTQRVLLLSSLALCSTLHQPHNCRRRHHYHHHDLDALPRPTPCPCYLTPPSPTFLPTKTVADWSPPMVWYPVFSADFALLDVSG
ncbi:hypothetical protein HDK64DRAFT_260847 [Phyllosticta capitalensis]